MSKFELSLWRDYYPSETINKQSKENPGGLFTFIKRIDDLKIGESYYVWHENQWKYPMSLTNIEEDLSFSFIDSNGQRYENLGNLIATQGIGKILNNVREEKLQILANENMEYFQGRIKNINFVTKLDGTHTLSFEVPKYYFDFYSQERKQNEYLEWLRLKSKLKLFYKNKWFTFTINSKTEKKNKKEFIYSFEANDLVLEELSKNGYTLNFTDNEETIELFGLGTAIELAERVVEGTDWVVNKNLCTADFQEFKEETVLNPLTGLYEDKKIPVIAYQNSYSPCLKKYVYQTEFYYKDTNIENEKFKNNLESFYAAAATEDNITLEKTEYPIYFTEETEVSSAGSVENLITVNSNFSSFSDWEFEDNDNESEAYGTLIPDKSNDDGVYDLLVKNSENWLVTSNFTSNMLKAGYYVFYIKTRPNQDAFTYDIKLSTSNSNIFEATNLKSNCYYVLRTSKSISSPRLKIKFNNEDIYIREVALFNLDLRKYNSNEELSVTGGNLGLYINDNPVHIEMGEAKELNLKILEEEPAKGIIENNSNHSDTFKNYIILPNSIVNSEAMVKRKYFIEPYKTLKDVMLITNDNITELSESLVLEIDEELLLNQLNISESQILKTYENEDGFSETLIDENARMAYENNQFVCYKNKREEKEYYKPIQIEYKNEIYYLWKKALLLYTNEKRRLITASKSNRYSILQDIAEKFGVFVQFRTLHNPTTGEILYQNNKPIKEIYFIDQVGTERYAGFRDGINLESTTRKIISDEVVTKMYVENIEADYNEDGLLSIQLSDLNPTKENYIYNFRHFLNTNSLNNEFKQELTEHEGHLNALNTKYLSQVDIYTQLSEGLIKDKAYIKTLEESLDSLHAQIDKIKEQVVTYGPYYNNWNQEVAAWGREYSAKELLELYYEDPSDKKIYQTEDISTDYARDTNNNEPYYNAIIILDDNKEIRENFNSDPESYYVFAELHFLYDLQNRADWTSEINADNKFIENKDGTFKVQRGAEYYFKNENLPLEKDIDYYILDGEEYKIVDNPKEKNRTNYYIKKVGSTNIDWDYDNTNGVYYSWGVSSTGKPYYRYLANSEYHYLKKEGSKDHKSFGELLVENNWISHDNEVSCIKLQTTETLATKKETINLLIDQEKEIFKNLHEAKVAYYIDKERYEAAYLLATQLLAAKQDLINNFENKYSQFIKEGYWSETGYSNNNSFYLDAVCVSNDSALPKIECTLNVLDLTSIDYFKEFEIEVGDETFAIDKEIFGVDKNNSPIKERIIVTELNEQLDNSKNNKITIKNYTNRFEDLFSRITASVTAVETREDTWNRANILNQDGTIDSSLLSTINAANTSLVNNSIGLKNTYTLNEQGLNFISQLDSNYQTKITSLGIFCSDSAKTNGQWMTAISATGINASAITTGEIKTSLITIVSDYAPGQTWTGLGITAYSDTGRESTPSINTNTFTRFDRYGLYLMRDQSGFGFKSGKPWFLGLNEEEAVTQIQEKANVSITKRGFAYNSIYGAAKIKIGLLDLNNKIEGIDFNNNGNTIFKVSTEGTAQLCCWNFDQSKMWKDNFNTLKDAYDNDGSFYIGNDGLAMKNIKLLTEEGKLVCSNIELTGGKIEGNDIQIKKAMMGPFKFFSENQKGYIYSYYYNNKFVTAAAQLEPDSSKSLLNKDNKFYLGNFVMTQNILKDCGFPVNIYDSNTHNKDANGILLSIGNDFWVHTSGVGYFGSDIYFNGTVYAKRLDIEEGINVTGEITLNGEDILKQLNTVNNYYTTTSCFGAVTPKDATEYKDITSGIIFRTSFPNDITVRMDTTAGAIGDFSGLPCLEFKYGKFSCYLVYKGNTSSGNWGSVTTAFLYYIHAVQQDNGAIQYIANILNT